MKTRKRKCLHCGIEFITASSNKVYCTPKCRETARYEREHSYRPDIAPDKKEKRPSRIDEINRLAKEAGMSYGKYVAMKYLEGKNEQPGKSTMQRLYGPAASLPFKMPEIHELQDRAR